MNLKEANKELERLENEEEFWKNELIKVELVALPKSTDITADKISGGKREDKFFKYVSLKDEKKIEETLRYIEIKKENLVNWLEKELKILLKYGEAEAVVIQLKENKRVKDNGKYREMTWEEISKEVHWSKSFCRTVYRNYKKTRKDTP